MAKKKTARKKASPKKTTRKKTQAKKTTRKKATRKKTTPQQESSPDDELQAVLNEAQAALAEDRESWTAGSSPSTFQPDDEFYDGAYLFRISRTRAGVTKESKIYILAELLCVQGPVEGYESYKKTLWWSDLANPAPVYGETKRLGILLRDCSYLGIDPNDFSFEAIQDFAKQIELTKGYLICKLETPEGRDIQYLNVYGGHAEEEEAIEAYEEFLAEEE